MKKLNSPKVVIVGIIILAIIIIISLFGYFLVKDSNESIDEKMTELVDDYYKTKIKDWVFGVDKHKITLRSLEDANYNIEVFKEHNCNFETSYSYVVIDETKEINPDNSKYTIETFLMCD